MFWTLTNFSTFTGIDPQPSAQKDGTITIPPSRLTYVATYSARNFCGHYYLLPYDVNRRSSWSLGMGTNHNIVKGMYQCNDAEEHRMDIGTAETLQAY